MPFDVCSEKKPSINLDTNLMITQINNLQSIKNTIYKTQIIPVR